MHPVIFVFLILPVVAVAILVVVRRAEKLKPLMPSLVLSGIAAALATAFLAFTRMAIPIAPYETGRGAWLPVLGQIALALYVGFGVGVSVAILIGLPYRWLATRSRR